MNDLRDTMLRRIAKLYGSKDGSGTVYYICSPETARIKIGYTSGNPSKRLKALRTGSPTPLHIMAMHPGGHEDEQFIHQCMSASRVHGEWFDADDDVFNLVAYVCWVACVYARIWGEEAPKWAAVGIAAIEEEYGPISTDLGRLVH